MSWCYEEGIYYDLCQDSIISSSQSSTSITNISSVTYEGINLLEKLTDFSKVNYLVNGGIQNILHQVSLTQSCDAKIWFESTHF